MSINLRNLPKVLVLTSSLAGCVPYGGGYGDGSYVYGAYDSGGYYYAPNYAYGPDYAYAPGYPYPPGGLYSSHNGYSTSSPSDNPSSGYPPPSNYQRPMQQSSTPPAQKGWYYCDNPRGYFPDIESCNTKWRQVPVSPPEQLPPPQ